MSNTLNVALCLRNHRKKLSVEIVLNVEHVSKSVGVSDVVADVRFISDVDPQMLLVSS
jgi:hypothetical protein